jgi:hypothetical protein
MAFTSLSFRSFTSVAQIALVLALGTYALPAITESRPATAMFAHELLLAADVNAQKRKPPQKKTVAKARVAADTEVSAALRQFCQAYIAAMRREFLARNFRAHAELAAGFVKRLRRVPLAQLRSCEDVLVTAVAKDGVEPYITPLVDHGYRLARVASVSNQRRYLAIKRTVVKKVAGSKRKGFGGTVLIKAADSLGYRPYSANAGYALLALTYSRFGRAQFAKGGSPEHLLRLLELYRNCVADSKIPRPSKQALKPEQRRSCDALVAEVDKSFQEVPGNISAADLVNAIQGGITSGVRACLAADDPTAKLISQFEEYTECRRAEQARHAQSAFTPSGLMSTAASGALPHQGGQKTLNDLLAGLSLVKETHDDGANLDGFWKQSDYEYQGPDGTKVTVSDYEQQTPGQAPKQGTNVVVSNNEGTTTYNFEGAKGGEQRLEGMEHTSSDGRYSYHADFNSDGSSTETAIDNQTGDFATVETDANGNQKVTEGNINSETGETTTTTVPASTTQPPDGETIASQCNLGNRRPDKQLNPAAAGLGPWIIPATDATPITDSCLTAFSNNSPQQCPPSVALCVDPPPAGSCTCGTPGQGPSGSLVPQNACAAINCGPDASCNASTGTCTTGGGGSFPGAIVRPVRPTLVGGPLRPGLPARTRTRLLRQDKLWYPSATKPGLVEIFGTRPTSPAKPPAAAGPGGVATPPGSGTSGFGCPYQILPC